MYAWTPMPLLNVLITEFWSLNGGFVFNRVVVPIPTKSHGYHEIKAQWIKYDHSSQPNLAFLSLIMQVFFLSKVSSVINQGINSSPFECQMLSETRRTLFIFYLSYKGSYRSKYARFFNLCMSQKLIVKYLNT